MGGKRPEYRPQRYGRQLWPVPPTGQGDAWTRTHKQVRVAGERSCHVIVTATPTEYVTRCGLTIAKTDGVRTWRRQWCDGDSCRQKHERPGSVDSRSGRVAG